MTPETLAPVTVEAFWYLSHHLPKAELVAGQVVELTPPGARHGRLAFILPSRLRDHVEGRGLGILLVETGFVLSEDPATVRGPDVAVILAPRVPSPLPVRFFPGPPDLAIEILSPDDRPGEVAAKVADYLRAGTQAVWVVDPETEMITAHSRTGVIKYRADDVLDGAPVLPAFRASVRALLSD